MKIKNKLYLITAVSIGLFILIAITINTANNKMKTAMMLGETLLKIQKNLSDLSVVTYEFLLYKEERMLAQWDISYSSTLKLSEISEEALPILGEPETINSLRSNILSMEDMFSRLNSILLERRALVNKGASEKELSAIDSLEARLTSQLQVKLHDAKLDSLMLERFSHDITEAVREKANVVVIFSLLLYTVYLATALFLMYGSIASPLEDLIKGTEIVGADNLDYKIGIHSKDELGRLSNAFNTMTGNLKRVTASRDELNREISERKAVEKALLASNQELEAFSYSVSHDLRAPLRSIDGFSHALVEDYREKLDEQGKDYLRRVRAASQRMGLLIDDMLALSRITRSEMKLVKADLSAIAREVAAELRESDHERNVEFIVQDGLVAYGDKGLLRLVLENLLGNAWKFTSKHPSAKIEFGVKVHDGKPAYFVRDNGEGFDMAYAGKLFKPFQRLHAVTCFPGTGVGLATVKRIINRHGGEVWAEGAVGKGATFNFRFNE